MPKKLTEKGYKVAHINFENYKNTPVDTFLEKLVGEINKFWGTHFETINISKLFYSIETHTKKKFILIIDEVEGINENYFGDFLHSIQNVYHSRDRHCLKSVILVGVSNIVGVVSDNGRDGACPVFTITDNLNIPYFTTQEVFELIGQHEKETGQLFDEKVKEKICQITANQPGLVNGFAKKLVEDYPDKDVLTYSEYLKVEDWYLTEAIDKNFSNILNKAKQARPFVERLLFTEDKIPFRIDRPSIFTLHTNGLIKKDNVGNVTFWVPFYKKRLYDAFYPYTNGEKSDILRSFVVQEHFDENNKLKLDKLISGYKEYVQKRGFKVFLCKKMRWVTIIQ